MTPLAFRKIIPVAAVVPTSGGGSSGSGYGVTMERKVRGLRHLGDRTTGLGDGSKAEREQEKACPAQVMMLPFTKTGVGDEKRMCRHLSLQGLRGKQGGSVRRELDVCVSALDSQIREL